MIRDNIIETLKRELEQDNDVYALWLEGADSLGNVDRYSDIDMVLDVKDNEESRILSKIEDILQSFDSLDLNWEAPQPTSKLRYKIYHIKDTSEHLFIDVNVQSHSREFNFIEGHPFEKPLVLFDKKNVIKFEKLNKENLGKSLQEQLATIDILFFQRSKVKKYILRYEYLEALAYYHKHVLDPLVMLLRIIHTPLIADYGPIHISKHLPQESLQKLEKMYQTSSLDDLKKRLQEAELWFNDLRETAILKLERGVLKGR